MGRSVRGEPPSRRPACHHSPHTPHEARQGAEGRQGPGPAGARRQAGERLADHSRGRDPRGAGRPGGVQEGDRHAAHATGANRR